MKFASTILDRLNNTYFPALLSLAGALVSLYPANPTNAPVPSRDSGVFLYVGWRVLHGEIPSRDVWDHKPPLIYFTDALGLSLSPDSMWGVWAVQFFFIFFAIFFLYKALQENLGTLPAIYGAVFFSSGLLAVMQQGNVTEEYALLFQIICFWLVAKTHKKNYSRSSIILIGLAGGFAFFYKQNTIGVWLAFGLLLIWNRLVTKNLRKLPVDLLSLGAGVILLSGILALYFGAHNALSEFWEQAFRYNFVYIRKGDTLKDLISLLIKGFTFLSLGNLLYFTVAGWLAAFVFIWVHRKSWLQSLNPLIFLAILDFPIEVLMIAVSGRSILHYYLTPLPSMAFLVGIFVYALIIILEKIFKTNRKIFWSIGYAFLLIILGISQLQQVRDYPAYMEQISFNWYEEILSYVDENTKDYDPVLILGAETTINFISRRVSPTRYVYQYPLQLLGKRSMVEEFFEQILQDKPRLIIDTRGRRSLDEKLFVSIRKRSDAVDGAIQYLTEAYEPVFYYGDWIIYKHKN